MAWLHVALSNPLVFAGSGGRASRKDGASVRTQGCAVRTGRRAEQAAVVQISSAAVTAPFPWRQQ